MNGPFSYYPAKGAALVEATSAEERLRLVTQFGLPQCERALEIPGLQSCVLKAIARRQRKLALTPIMQCAIDAASNNGGRLVRHPGGFWSWDGATYEDIRYRSFGTPTVEALVRRGVAVYTDFRDGRQGTFPIVCRVCR